MTQPPKWYLPVAIVALLWNLLGCAAYLADVMIKPEDLAKLTAAQQAMYHARPAWSIAGTAFAVWFGALGSIGLIAKRRWAYVVLLISLAGCVVQDTWLFALSGASGSAGVAGLVLQLCVLGIAFGLVYLAKTAISRDWVK